VRSEHNGLADGQHDSADDAAAAPDIDEGDRDRAADQSRPERGDDGDGEPDIERMIRGG
jgi:hypothetical protein